jgi:hypothetical protein
MHARLSRTPCQALAHSGEQLAGLEREAAVHAAVAGHPNILPLLAAGSAQSMSQDGGVVTTHCMLFPAYCDGTLAAELERLHSGGSRLHTTDVLDIFLQASGAARPARWHCRARAVCCWGLQAAGWGTSSAPACAWPAAGLAATCLA